MHSSDGHTSFPNRPGRRGPLPTLVILGEEKHRNSTAVWSHCCWGCRHTPVHRENWKSGPHPVASVVPPRCTVTSDTGAVVPKLAFCCGEKVRLLEGPSGPPSRPLPPALLLLSQSPWFSPWWFSLVHLFVGVHMPGRPPYGGAPTKKPGIQQPSTVSTENTEKLEKVAHPSQAKAN